MAPHKTYTSLDVWRHQPHRLSSHVWRQQQQVTIRLLLHNWWRHEENESGFNERCALSSCHMTITAWENRYVWAPSQFRGDATGLLLTHKLEYVGGKIQLEKFTNCSWQDFSIEIHELTKSSDHTKISFCDNQIPDRLDFRTNTHHSCT